MWILLWYLGASAFAVALYWRDKSAARRGRRRIRERTLHFAELIGGWPGAIAARQLLRHKTRDAKFLLVSYGVIAVHAAIWAARLWLKGG
jgi:uncharacterized membrane protein YsdA (DUF1294 family)